MEADSGLRNLLDESGLSEGFWGRIAEAVRQGGINELASLLKELEDTAAAAGLDGVTVQTRVYKPLPPSPGVCTVAGWRCPHPLPCGRAEVGADQRIERRCELTCDPLEWVSVTSG